MRIILPIFLVCFCVNCHGKLSQKRIYYNYINILNEHDSFVLTEEGRLIIGDVIIGNNVRCQPLQSSYHCMDNFLIKFVIKKGQLNVDDEWIVKDIRYEVAEAMVIKLFSDQPVYIINAYLNDKLSARAWLDVDKGVVMWALDLNSELQRVYILEQGYGGFASRDQYQNPANKNQ